jgi:DNA-binding NtrC family response regulator
MTLTAIHDVLLVDDEPVFRESTRELIREAGFACDAAGDVETAVQLLSLHSYRLVIADLHMPGSGGMDLLKTLSRFERRPVAMIATGYPSLDSALQSIDVPVAAYLIKPLDIDDLLARIRRVLEPPRPTTAGRLQHLLASAERSEPRRDPVWFDQTMLQVLDLLEQLNEAWHDRHVDEARDDSEGRDLDRSLRALLARIESGCLSSEQARRIRAAVDAHLNRREP